MSSKKVLLRYVPEESESDELETSFAITLPASWSAGPVDKLHTLFCDQFNKKHPGSAVSKEDSHLEHKHAKLANDCVLSESGLQDGAEVFLVRGQEVKPPKNEVKEEQEAKPVAPAAASSPLLPCKRFGCRQKFDPKSPAGPCRHHKKPPVFHETRKFWACCPDKIGWDWDSFEAIAGCEESAEHTNEAAGARVMGGTELRAEINGPVEQAKAVTSLDRLMKLREALVSVGVSGDEFDRARDAIKRVHEDQEGKRVWDKVAEEMAKLFTGALLLKHE